jgi:hypothetical protein
MDTGRALVLGLLLLFAAPALAPAREPPDPPPPTKPLDLALAWLADHQEEDGRWDAEAFWLRSDGRATDGMGKAVYTPGVTGLALLAFVRAGHSDVEGAHQDTVRKGAGYLTRLQDDRGCFGPRRTKHFVYAHAIATEVMARLFARNRSPLFREAAERGVAFIRACQNPYKAWRYGIRPGDNDTSVTGWMVSALAAAREAGIRVDAAAFDGARAWLDQVTDLDSGRVGYVNRGEHVARPGEMLGRFPPQRSEALTAEGILLRIFTGAKPEESRAIELGTGLLLNLLPRWEPDGGTTDFYYWYWGTRAMRRVGGEAWERWREAARRAILTGQRRDDRFRGSWDPAGPWGSDGGRVYSTALMAVVAEIVREE